MIVMCENGRECLDNIIITDEDTVDRTVPREEMMKIRNISVSDGVNTVRFSYDFYI